MMGRLVAAWRSGRALVVAFALLAAAAASAGAETRIALLIGNDEYQGGVTRLRNAANDARAVDRALRAAGFETVLELNASRHDMDGAIQSFTQRLSPGTVGLLYYAGHGIQANGINYLIPVDAQIETEADLPGGAVDLSKVLQAMDDAESTMNVVILDACRDNPLPKSRAIVRGLARVEAPRGTFIAYAAGPGQTAKDGPPGGNGIFTGELVKALDQPGLKIEDVFKRVAVKVLADTANQQTPWTESSIQNDFFFHPRVETPAPVAIVAPPPPTPGPAVPAPVVDTTVELAFWDAIKESKDPADYQAYLNKYPEGDFAELARIRLERLKAPQAEPEKQSAEDAHPSRKGAAQKAAAPKTARTKTPPSSAGSSAPQAATSQGAAPRSGPTVNIYVQHPGSPQPAQQRQQSAFGQAASSVGQTAKKGALSVAETVGNFFRSTPSPTSSSSQP